MSTHSLGHQSSGFGFATSLLSKPKTHGSTSNLGKKNSFLQVSTKPSPNLRKKILAKYLYVFTDYAAEDCSATLVEIADELSDPPFGQLITFSVLPLASLHSGSLGSTVLLRKTDRRPADCSFPRLLIHFLQGLAY
ncbi:hypothetical protein H5410_057388 [Solanum commersonii]|uniref:Uncharacterized protein n=1 Tax=Solanum commersonii TaxID=4109 RepID=A0A9J5WQP6_SOLCO|nr:hypothetical protein H5410_057388 [Solanum commersonii]